MSVPESRQPTRGSVQWPGAPAAGDRSGQAPGREYRSQRLGVLPNVEADVPFATFQIGDSPADHPLGLLRDEILHPVEDPPERDQRRQRHRRGVGGVRVEVYLQRDAASLLGVGGGFLLMPAMMYGLGVPAAIAVGTDILQITISGAFGAFVYARDGFVALPVVATLLAGSALGARIGAGVSELVDEDDIKGYFATMLLAGSVAVAAKRVGTAYDIGVLNTASIALIFGATVVVSGAILLAAVCQLRDDNTGFWCRLSTT